MSALSLFLTPAFLPFGVAALVLLGLVLVEAAALMFGASLLGLAAHGAHGHDGLHLDHAMGAHDGIDPFGWLNAGRVPFTALLMLLLGAFAASGFLIQSLALRSGAPLPTLIAAGLALAAALPITRAGSRLVARILPRDETYAIDDDALIGRVATVTVGPLVADKVGRASVSDGFGNRHYPRVRPLDPTQTIAVGAKVLIISREGREFRVGPAPDLLT